MSTLALKTEIDKSRPEPVWQKAALIKVTAEGNFDKTVKLAALDSANRKLLSYEFQNKTVDALKVKFPSFVNSESAVNQWVAFRNYDDNPHIHVSVNILGHWERRATKTQVQQLQELVKEQVDQCLGISTAKAGPAR